MPIKRPLIWIIASYLAGILLMNIPIYVIVLLFCLFFILVLLGLWYLYKTGTKLIAYCFLLSLPFFYLLGWHLTSEQTKPSQIDVTYDGMDVILQGELIAIEEKEDYQRLILKKVRMKSLENNEQKDIQVNQVIIYNSNNTQYRLGNILEVSGQFKKFQPATNPGQFNELQYYKRKNIDFKVNAKEISISNKEYNFFLDYIYHLKLKLQNVYNSILSEKEAGILTAMILGDTNSLDEDVSTLYRRNGISHIIAISGLHVSLLGLTLFKLLRRISIPILPATVACVILLYAYGILTNFSVSTNRSIVMLVLYMTSLLLGRTYDLLSGTAFSALIILIQNPLELFNPGFLLSFGAILAIGTLFPVLKNMIPIQNQYVHSLCMCIAIQVVTTPILLYYFYEIPTYSVLINLIIIPLSSLVILLAVIAAILGAIYLPVGIFFVGGAHFLLVFFERFCTVALSLPGNSMVTGRPNSLVILSYYLILVIFLLLNNQKIKRLSVFMLAFLAIIYLKPYSKELEITFLDVGQGDGVVMNLPGDITFLIDGGSTNISDLGKYRIEPYLKYKGITSIDYAVITHVDKDHISGVMELMGSMKEDNTKDKLIKNLVLPYINSSDEAYESLITLAGRKGIPVLVIKKGDVFNIGEISIRCLHPTKEFIATSRNAYSTVLSLTYKEFDLLLTGDLEKDGEILVTDELMNDIYGKKDYEVLKVAHHGSKFSSYKEFLDLVKPEYAIISCAMKNTYGHPHRELLDRLKEVTDDIKITYETGAVTISTNGERMRVWEYLEVNKK